VSGNLTQLAIIEAEQKMKPRLDEVAKLAGVGIATVDRVLNERGGVSPKTALKVIEAARQLGIGRVLPSPYRRLLRVKVIMPSHRTPLLQRLARAFKYQSVQNIKTLVIERVLFEERNTAAVPEMVRKGTADAVIVFVPESSAMIEAIASATSSGTPIITLVSDLPTTPRLAYVGIDHYRAGRAAGLFMARMARQKKFLAVCSSLKYRAEASRISGFRDSVRAELADTPPVDVLEGDAWPRTTCDQSVGGLYIAGSKVSLALSLEPWLPTNPVVIVHDLDEEVQRLMHGGAITLTIDQNPEEQASRSIAILLSRLGITSHNDDATMVPFTIHTRHNIAQTDEFATAGRFNPPPESD